MLNRFLTVLMIVCSSFAYAVDKAVIQSFEKKLKRQSVHMVENGREYSLYIPIDEVYFEQTSYLTEGSEFLIKNIEGLVKISTGQIMLQGLYDQNSDSGSFNSSALYSQVAHFSSFLLKSNEDVSYSPITVKGYERNDNYGFWSLYPSTSRFIRLSLYID